MTVARNMFPWRKSFPIANCFELEDIKCKGLILPNKIRVILISNPYAPSSSAALSLPIGSMHDPYETKGLAHLLEHVIAREMNECSILSAMSREHVGTIEASTFPDHVVYHYKHLRITALETFANRFFNPEFDSKIIMEEITAMNSEFVIHSTQDPFKIGEFMYCKWNDDRIPCKFRQGNKETLYTELRRNKIDVKEKLQNFYTKFYCTDIMSLCVYSSDNLNSLETNVKHWFSIPNRRGKLLSPSVLPEIAYNVGTQWFIAPTALMRDMTILFPLPDNYDKLKNKPADYISYLLKHCGSESLYSLLRAKEWCENIDCHILNTSHERYICLSLELTDTGLKKIDDIIVLVFRYLKLLSNNPPNKDIYEEYRRKNLICRSLRCDNISSEVGSIASYINKYPSRLHKVLKRTYFYGEKFRRDAIRQLLREIVLPRNMIVCIQAKESELDVSLNETTRWFQTKYLKQRIPNNTISMWSNLGKDKHFDESCRIPGKSKFTWNLNTNRAFVPMEASGALRCISNETNFIKMWFKQHKEKKFEMCLQFSCHQKYHNPEGYNLNAIFALILRDYMTDYIYSMKLVGITCNFVSNIYGIKFVISNHQYDDKLLTDVIKPMVDGMLATISVYKDRFEMLKKEYIKSLENYMTLAPEDLARHYLEVILTEQLWEYEKLLQNVNSIDGITSEKMLQFILDFFNEMFVEGIVHANVTESEVKIIIEHLDNCFLNIRRPTGETPTTSDIVLQKRDAFIFKKTTSFHKYSCTLVYYQTGLYSIYNTDIKCCALLRIIYVIIVLHCQRKLRFQEHLGYSVSVEMIMMNDTCGLTISVLGHECSTAYVESRIDQFMHDMLTKIHEMHYETIDAYKKLAISRRPARTKMAKKFYTTNIYWQQILSKDTVVCRLTKENEFIIHSTHEDICELLQKMISVRSHRKLSIHIKSESLTQEENNKICMRLLANPNVTVDNRIRKRKPEKIEDIASFKNMKSSRRVRCSIIPMECIHLPKSAT